MAQRGWLYVLIGLLISSFLGGAVHVFLSPERVRVFVVTLLAEKQPKFDIEFQSAKLQLANGLWPALAVELDGIIFRAKDPCVTNSTLHIDQLIIPFEIRSLFTSKLRFGDVHAGKVQFFIRPGSCKAKAGDKVVTDDFMSLERFFQKRWSKEVVNTTRYLDQFSIDELQLLRDDQVLAPVVVKDLEMKFLGDKGESEVSFLMHLGEPWVGREPVGDIKTEILVRSDSVTVTGRSNLKEGQFQVTGEWVVDRGDIHFQLFSQDMPAQNVLGIIRHWNLVEGLNPTLKNQWLNCDLSIRGMIRDFWSLPIELHQCRLYGDLGEMIVKTHKIDSLATGGEVHLQIQDLDVRQVLSGVGLRKHWPYVSQYGRFSGELKVFDRSSYEILGEIRNAEIYGVSNVGQMHQKIDHMDLKVDYKDSHFLGQASQFVIGSGEVKGEVDFDFSSVGSGRFNIGFSQLSLPVSLQKVLWRGVATGVAIKAHGETTESILTGFAAAVKIDDFQTHQWSMENIKLVTQLKNSIWAVTTRAAHFALKPESNWRSFFMSLFSFVESTDRARLGDYSLYDLSGEVLVSEAGRKVEWSKGHASTVDRKTTFRSEGHWQTGEGVNGTIHGQYPRKSVNWLVYGDGAAPQIKSAVGL